MTETKRGKRTSNGKHWSRKGDRSRKKTSRRSVHLSREPCLEQGLPSPKTRSSSRPPPKNPRMDEIKRAVRSSFSPPLLSRSPSSCLFACLFADSNHWAFLGETVPCFFQSFSGLVEKEKNERKKEEFYFWKSWYTDKVIIFSLSLSLSIFRLVWIAYRWYIKIVLYDVGKWLKCIRDWKYKRKLRWSALSDFQTR